MYQEYYSYIALVLKFKKKLQILLLRNDAVFFSETKEGLPNRETNNSSASEWNFSWCHYFYRSFTIC